MLIALAACGGDSSGDGGGLPRGIIAEKRAPVTGPGACGVADAWVVSEVAGVRLTQPAIMNPRTARALDAWVRRGAIPAVDGRGGGLESLVVVAHYACRTRNSRPGAKISEHAKGNAIDIAAFQFRDGSNVSVLRGWNGRDGRLLRRLHRTACGPFGTVLGPESDRHHQDHFHFDTARHRGGPYCQ
jgi:hypothetical protein